MSLISASGEDERASDEDSPSTPLVLNSGIEWPLFRAEVSFLPSFALGVAALLFFASFAREPQIQGVGGLPDGSPERGGNFVETRAGKLSWASAMS